MFFRGCLIGPTNSNAWSALLLEVGASRLDDAIKAVPAPARIDQVRLALGFQDGKPPAPYANAMEEPPRKAKRSDGFCDWGTRRLHCARES